MRQFEKFIEEFDPERSYSNLRKVCDKRSGKAIWVSYGSADLIEGEVGAENEGAIGKLTAELVEKDEMLVGKDELLAAKEMENVRLVEELEKLKRNSKDDEKTPSKAEKLRNEVRDAREG